MLVVVYYSFSVKLVLFPLALVGYHAVWIVKNSIPVHFIFEPLAIIVAALFVVKFSLAVSHAIKHVSFITSSNVISFFNINRTFSQRRRSLHL